MKDMLKSKFVILFVVFMLGVIYFNSLGLEKLNNNNNLKDEIILNK